MPLAGPYVVRSNLLDLRHSLMSARCWDGAAAVPMIGGLMAHIQKYKAHSCGHMLAHYRRDAASLERDNVEPSLTHLNRTLVLGSDCHAHDGDAEPHWELIAGRIADVDAAARAEGRRVTRKDAVVMADLVITLPENVPAQDGDRFFELSYEFFGEKVGRDNLMGGFVHRDEMRTKKDKETGKMVRTGERVRDHIHVPWTPILDGRFNFKQQCPRTFYKTIHRELGDYLEAQMGYRPDIELSEEQRGEKALSEVKNKDIQATRDAIERKEERLECLQGQIEEMEPLAVTFGESARTLVEHRGDGSRERELEAEESGLRSGIVELERQVQEARSRAGQLERDIERLGMGVRDAGERCERARGRVARLIERLGCIPTGLSEFATAIGRKLGFHVRDAFAARLDWAVGVSADMSRGRSVSREKDAPWKAEHR